MAGASQKGGSKETCIFTSDHLDLTDENLEKFDITSWNCSRPVWHGGRCIWHARTLDKPLEKLEAEIGDGDLHGASLSGLDLSSLSFPDSAGLIRAELSEADLRDVDLSGADLRWADLSDADVRRVNLSGAEMFNTDLSESDLRWADLSDADMRRADLHSADLFKSDLSGADLVFADLSEADIRDITLENVTLARSTQIDPPREGIRSGNNPKVQYKAYNSRQRFLDWIARANNELRNAFSHNGLIRQARHARIRERRARREEALIAEGTYGTVLWFGSLLSRVFTGYGVKLKPVAGWMLMLYFVSSYVYVEWGGMEVTRSLYYSVVTFTTAPPETPPAGLSRIVAGIETFAGTLAIVFLGYVLGMREQV